MLLRRCMRAGIASWLFACASGPLEIVEDAAPTRPPPADGASIPLPAASPDGSASDVVGGGGAGGRWNGDAGGADALADQAVEAGTCVGCVTDIALDGDEMCIVTATGALSCSSTMMPGMPVLTGATKIAITADTGIGAAIRVGCAIASDASLRCWDAKTGAAVQSSPSSVTAVATRGVVAIRNGTLVWGTGVTAGNAIGGFFTNTGLVEVASGCDICTITAAGTPQCINGGVPTVTFAHAVDISMDFGCLIETATSLPRCWSHFREQLALHATTLTSVATSGPGGTTEADGPGVACGLRPTGAIDCWQAKPAAPAFASATAAMLTPPAGTYKKVVGGAHRFCAIDLGGSVVCWGTGNPAL